MAKKSTAMTTTGGQTGLATSPTTMGLFKVDPKTAVDEAIAREGTKLRPKVHSLKEPGDCIAGLLLREGPTVECTRADGEVVAVKTFVFGVGGKLEVALMSSYQLDHELPDLFGKFVRVIYAAEQRTNAGNRVKDFFIEYWDSDAETMAPAAEEIAS
jgi:hypothetical protein